MLKVRGVSVSIPLFRVEEDGKVGVINLGEAIEKLINEQLKPVRIHLIHVVEYPDPSINIGGVSGKKAVVTVIYEA
ncbi:MAG: hypothetical protein QXO67_03525 [Candidatus Bathyarchaeia archaeon]